MPEIYSEYGQSHYDLTIQAYGSLDNAIKFARENNILDMDADPIKVYTYNTESILNLNNVGYKYTTRASIERIFGLPFGKNFG